jgi:hypothetical protein
MEKTRKIRLAGVWLRIVNGRAVLVGRTQNEARYEIEVVDFGPDEAQCAMTQCGEFIASRIKVEREQHKHLRSRAASAWSAINVAIEGEAKPS